MTGSPAASPPTRGSRRPNPPKGTTTPPAQTRAHPAADPAAGGGGERRVALAAVTGAHGIGGELRLKLFTADLTPYRELDAGGRTLTLEAVRPGPNGAVARIREIADRNAAEALRGMLLTVPRSALPPLEEGEYYHADLIGLAVVGEDGAGIGTVTGVENFGAGDILEIETPEGRAAMLPFRVPVAVLDAGVIRADAAFLA